MRGQAKGVEEQGDGDLGAGSLSEPLRVRQGPSAKSWCCRTALLQVTYPQWLLVIFGVCWLALAIRPADRKVWLMENSFTVALIGLLIFTYRRHSLSDLSYTLVFLFLGLHTIGAHYTYAKVPYRRWTE